MKKVAAALMATMATLLLCSAAMADTAAEYQVKKDDCLSLIGDHLNMRWQKIARINNLKPPYTIYPGQRLIIPGKMEKKFLPAKDKPMIWTKVGGDPYRGSWQKALDLFDLPEQIKVKIKSNIEQKKFKWSEQGLQNGQVLNQVIFGKNKVWNNVTCQWNSTQEYAFKDYGIDGYSVIQVLTCGNWAWRKSDDRPVLSEVVSKRYVLEPESKKICPECEEELGVGSAYSVDMDFYTREFGRKKQERKIYIEPEIFGGIGYNQAVDYSKNSVWFGYLKARLPLYQTTYNGINLRFAPFGAFGFWDGETDDYQYDGYKWFIGPSIKLTKGIFESNLDFGILGSRVDKGGIGSYQSKQRDWGHSISLDGIYGRRKQGALWLPQISALLEYEWYNDREHSHSFNGVALKPNPENHGRLGLQSRIGIYDFWNEEKTFRWTPGVEFGFSHEAREHKYGKGGVDYGLFGAVIAAGEQIDWATLHFGIQPAFTEGFGDLWYGFLNVDIWQIWKKVQASRIKKATPEDVEERRRSLKKESPQISQKQISETSTKMFLVPEIPNLGSDKNQTDSEMGSGFDESKAVAEIGIDGSEIPVG